MRNKTIALLVAGTLLCAPALAGAQSTSSQDRAASIAALEQRDDELRRAGPTGPKIGAVQRSNLARQRSQIRDLIERLEAGQSVDPHELDGALRQSP